MVRLNSIAYGFEAGADSIIIKGLIFEGGGTQYAISVQADYIKILDNNFYNWGGVNVGVAGANCLVDNNVFGQDPLGNTAGTSSSRYAVEIVNTGTDAVLSNNTFVDNYGGVSLAQLGFSNSFRTKIINNVFGVDRSGQNVSNEQSIFCVVDDLILQNKSCVTIP